MALLLVEPMAAGMNKEIRPPGGSAVSNKPWAQVPDVVMGQYIHSSFEIKRHVLSNDHHDHVSFGPLAHLVEHRLCKAGVVGSIPTGSTASEGKNQG